MKICIMCRSEIPDGANVCPSCNAYYPPKTITNKQEDQERTPMTLKQLYFSFSGRIGRGTYLLKGMIPMYLIIVFLGNFVKYIDQYSTTQGDIFYSLECMITYLGFILLAWAWIALIVKRLHDLDMPGFYIFLCLVPGLNMYYLFYIYFMRGTNGPNNFGSDTF